MRREVSCSLEALSVIALPSPGVYAKRRAQCFFFSSRRRHTRCLSDWSSDVCSSDLGHWSGFIEYEEKKASHRVDVTMEIKHTLFGVRMLLDSQQSSSRTLTVQAERDPRSEERRVGKECRCQRSQHD